MQAKLLSLDYKADNLIDYTKGIITRHYEYDGAQYYFSMFLEISNAPSHSLSGRYLAVLASIKGVDHFYIESDGEGNYSIVESESDIDEDESSGTEAMVPIMEIVKDNVAAETVEHTPIEDEPSMAPVIKMSLPSSGIDMGIENPVTGQSTSGYDGVYDDDPYSFLNYRAFGQESGILTLMSIAIAQWKEAN